MPCWADGHSRHTHHCTTTGTNKKKHHVGSVRLPCSSIKPPMWANTNDDWIVFKFSCSFEYLAGIKTGLKHMRLVHINERNERKKKYIYLNKTTVAPAYHQFACKTLGFSKGTIRNARHNSIHRTNIQRFHWMSIACSISSKTLLGCVVHWKMATAQRTH